MLPVRVECDSNYSPISEILFRHRAERAIPRKQDTEGRYGLLLFDEWEITDLEA